MGVAEVPDVVVRMFGDAHASLELLDRVDQTWEAVAKSQSPPNAAYFYVRAVEAVSGAVLDGLSGGGVIRPEDTSAVVTSASLAPVTEATAGPGHAVLIAILGVVASTGLAAAADVSTRHAILDAIGTLRGTRKSVRQRAADNSLRSTPSVVQAISEVLTDTYEPPLDAIRRVFQPRSDEEMGRWLGVSRTTVADWSASRFAPSAERERRLDTVVAIARLVDRHVHPEDVQRYLRDTPLPAFGGRTLDEVLSTDPAEGTGPVRRALELLHASLVQ